MSRSHASPAPASPRGRLLETRLLDVELIDASRHNGDQRLDALDELQVSIRAQGILQPVIVRPLEDAGFELVAGHRRLECARRLGFEEVPAQIMSLTEAEAREVQLVENLQRENLAPLDEAEAIAGLLELVSLDEAAARLGRSRSYLCGRMTLNRLPTGAKLALRAGTLSLSVALMVARIPDEELREAVATDVQAGRQAWDGVEFQSVPLTAGEARRAFARTMLELKRATFDTSDPMLLIGVPSCQQCPHRTGNAPDLFPEVGDADTCTSPPCFQRKRDAAWLQRREQAEQKGYKVLPDKRAKRILDFGGAPQPMSGFVAPGRAVGRDGDSRTWQQVAKAAKVKPQTYAVRNPETDKPVILWAADDLRELLPKGEKARLALPAGKTMEAEGGSAGKPPEAARPRGPADWEVEREAAAEIEADLAALAGLMGAEDFVRALFVGIVDDGIPLPSYLRLMELPAKTKASDLSGPQRQQVIALHLNDCGNNEVAAAFGVKVKAVLAAARARLVAAAEQKQDGKAGRAKKAAKRRRAKKGAR